MSKKAILKKAVKACKDGMGGYSATDSPEIKDYNTNAYYRAVKKARAFDLIARLSGLRKKQHKYPRSVKEAIAQLTGDNED
jgi:hypothetical protein